MPNLVLHKRILDSFVWDKDALSYFSRAGISNFTEKKAVDKLFKTWKKNRNIWNSVKNGCVYLVSPTSYGASLYNAVSSNFTITTGVAPSFSTNGWQFNGTTQYLKTGFNPNTSMTLNTGIIAIYSRTNSQSNNIPFGAADGSNNQWNAILRTSSGPADEARFRAFDGTTQTHFSNNNSSGIFVFSCTSSTNRFGRRNGVSIGTDTNTLGGSLVNFECYIGCRNLTGAANSFVPYELATVISGTIGLNTTDADVLYNSLATYNNTVISGGR
jgi:hypothetical protein